MPEQPLPDIVVAGTGPVGLVAALAFARRGFAVTLAGPGPDAADRRTTALMKPALAFLSGLVPEDAVRDAAAPLRVMRIVDGTRRLIRSPTVTFRASEIGEDFFGLNVPNSALNAALEAAVLSDVNIDWRRSLIETWTLDDAKASARLTTGAVVSARLAVAADGRHSAARAAAGITVSHRPYPQAALVLAFGHRSPHGDISTEFHTEGGPFTQVPLPGNRSSLVWVTSPAEADRLAALDDAVLSRQIEDGMHSILGAVAVEPGRQVYPLAAALPTRFAKDRVALVGEAAHLVPPIGAQGLNLGLRDVQELIDIAMKYRVDPGADAALAAYDRRRRPDILLRSGAVDLLNRSLLSDFLPAQLLRSAGLGLVGSFAPLRSLFMQEGMRPGSGLGAILSGLREQVRR